MFTRDSVFILDPIVLTRFCTESSNQGSSLHTRPQIARYYSIENSDKRYQRRKTASVREEKNKMKDTGKKRTTQLRFVRPNAVRHNRRYGLNKNPTRCNSMQISIYCKATLHVSGVTAPIIRSNKNCNRSLRYRS